MAKSQAENKPIFLSSGYSTCHWCHQMAKEGLGAFTSQDVADVLNSSFVPVKLDREERPDVDQVYMDFLTATEGHGGWPLSVFMTPYPHLSPIFAGTYYDRGTFLQLCKRVADLWSEEAKQPHLIAQTKQLMSAVAAANAVKSPGGGSDAEGSELGSVSGSDAQSSPTPSPPQPAPAPAGSEGGLMDTLRTAVAVLLGDDFPGAAAGPGSSSQQPRQPPPPPTFLQQLETDSRESTISALSRRFDPELGGFGRAPKFPRPTELRFLVHAACVTGAARPLRSGGAASASVPFMITRAMKEQLLEGGVTPEEIRNMKPADAHAKLKALQQLSQQPEQPSAPAPAQVPRGRPSGWPLDVPAVQGRIDATGLAVTNPSPVSLEGLERPEAALLMAWFSLRRMVAGGLHDHLGGGFHRYSTDRSFRTPHFEKMAYDQAALLTAICDAYGATGDPLLRSAGLATVQYVLRDLAHPGGGFFSAEDADSTVPAGRNVPQAPWVQTHGHGAGSGGAGSGNAHDEHKEGAFYAWTREEAEAALRADEATLAAASPIPPAELIPLFVKHYSLDYEGEAGNAGSSPMTDPHGELYGLSVLAESGTIFRTTATTGGRFTDEQVTAGLAAARRSLFSARAAARPRPYRDEKVLTTWTGQIVGALARAAVALSQPLEQMVPQSQQALARSGGDAMHYLPAPAAAVAGQPSTHVALSPAAVYAACIGAAEQAVAFIREELTVKEVGSSGASSSASPEPEATGEAGSAHPVRLLRSYCGGPSKVGGFLDDYTSLIDGLLELHQATGTRAHLEWAAALQAEQDRAFLDPSGRGVYLATRGDDPSVLYRSVPDQDGAEPCANAVASMNLLRLGALTGQHSYLQSAQTLLRYFEVPLSQQGVVSPLMGIAASMTRALESDALARIEVMLPADERAASVARQSLPTALASAMRDPAPKVIVHTTSPSLSRMRVQLCKGQTCQVLVQ